MIEVKAPARLHFGLFCPGAQNDETWHDREGRPLLPVRRFGGVGLTIEDPQTVVAVEPSHVWQAEGPGGERALIFARRYNADQPHRLVIRQAPPEHAGFGSGTQLGLAVAQALAFSTGEGPLSADVLARRVGRGLRSALGIHAFSAGGFLVEGGKCRHEDISPLIFRVPFPTDWRIVLALPCVKPGVHGSEEQLAFRALHESRWSGASVEALCRLVLLGLIPALLEGDIVSFGEALFDFNARAGEPFAKAQGGLYAHPAIADLVARLRTLGVRGVGQSSWGPAVFGIVAHEEEAERVRRRLLAEGPADLQVSVTHGQNFGALKDPPPGVA